MSESCRQRALALGEPLAGTATTTGARWLLIEHRGPWSSHVVREQVEPEVLRLLQAQQISVLCVRAFDDRSTGDGGWMWLTSTDRRRMSRWQFTDRFARDQQLQQIVDTGELPEAIAAPAQVSADPMLLVCTNGKRDACCAEVGRDILGGLARKGITALECSHIGGHRFAGVTLLLPWGYVHRVQDPSDAEAVLDHARQGQLVMSGLRGRTGVEPAVQVAEIAMRQQHALLNVDIQIHAEIWPVPNGDSGTHAPSDVHSKSLTEQDLAVDEDSVRDMVRVRLRLDSLHDVFDVERVSGPLRPESCNGEAKPLHWWQLRNP